MADASGDNDLRRLEREAEEARARLHHTIAEIKDPRTIENAKKEVMDRAGEMKDQILGYITGAKEDALQSGRDQTNEFARKLQRTALENPIPVLLIGAGIGWHLYKKPPITTALLGAGLYGLMKNWDGAADERAWRDPYNAASPRGYVPGGVAGYGYDEVTDVASAAERVKTVATNLVYGAEDAVSKVTDAVSHASERVRETVSGGVSQVKDAVGQQTQALAGAADLLSREANDRYADANSAMQDATSQMSDTLQDAKHRVQDLAQEAQRRAQPVIDRVSPYVNEHRNELGMLLVLAGAGVFAGGLLRSSETGRRFMSDARHRVNEGYDAVKRGSRDMAGAARRIDSSDWRERAEETKRRMSDRAASMRDAAADWRETAAERAARLREATMRNAGELKTRSARTMRSAQDMGAEHPLLLSAMGLAIGAVLGGMIRPTGLEKRTFGEAAESLRDAAADAVQGNLENLADKAGAIVSAVSEAVKGGGESADEQAQKQRDRRVTA